MLFLLSPPTPYSAVGASLKLATVTLLSRFGTNFMVLSNQSTNIDVFGWGQLSFIGVAHPTRPNYITLCIPFSRVLSIQRSCCWTARATGSRGCHLHPRVV